MSRKLVCLNILSFILAGCAIWTQLKLSDYTDRKYLFATVVPANWMRFNAGDYFVITKDGVILNYIRVYRQKFETKLEFAKKTFKADMIPQDWAEVEVDEVVSDPHVGAFKVLKNIPASIAGHGAFRLEYEYTAEGGLKKQGVVCGLKAGDWMYRIQFEAARQHYYQESIQDFERFLGKFQIIPVK